MLESISGVVPHFPHLWVYIVLKMWLDQDALSVIITAKRALK